MTSITFLSETPAKLGSVVFLDSPVEAIYVPSQALDAYKAHEDWAEHKDIIFAIPEIRYGDVNADGEINASDVLLLRKYMANLDYDTGDSSVVLGPKS